MSTNHTVFHVAILLILSLGVEKRSMTTPQKFNREYSNENNKSIWFHACDSDDVLSIEGLFLGVKTYFPSMNCFISTVTPEARLVAEYLTDPTFVKTIPHDDIDTMAYHFQRIQPKVIIIVRHQISPALILLARLYQVPIFLLDAHLSQKTERLLHTSNDFYWRVLRSFDQILVEEDKDRTAFLNIDIESNKISTVGPLKACNIISRKKMLLDYMAINEKQLKEKFQFPILLTHSLNKKNLELYLNIFTKLKTKFPTLKMIISPACGLSWKKDLIQEAQSAHLSYYIWDLNSVNVLTVEKAKSKKFLSNLEKIITSHDIILSCIDGSLFFWNAFAKVFIVDEATAAQSSDIFFEATAWKKPIIISPGTPQQFFHIKSELLEKNILIKVETEEQLTTQLIEFFSDENLRKTKGEEGYTWLKSISGECDKRFKPFFETLKEIVNN